MHSSTFIGLPHCLRASEGHSSAQTRQSLHFVRSMPASLPAVNRKISPCGQLSSQAPQGASLQKKLCPHPGAVVDGEALDIEHDAGLIHSGRLLFSAFVSAFVSASILPDAAGEKQWTTGRF